MGGTHNNAPLCWTEEIAPLDPTKLVSMVHHKRSLHYFGKEVLAHVEVETILKHSTNVDGAKAGPGEEAGPGKRLCLGKTHCWGKMSGWPGERWSRG